LAPALVLKVLVPPLHPLLSMSLPPLLPPPPLLLFLLRCRRRCCLSVAAAAAVCCLPPPLLLPPLLQPSLPPPLPLLLPSSPSSLPLLLSPLDRRYRRRLRTDAHHLIDEVEHSRHPRSSVTLVAIKCYASWPGAPLGRKVCAAET
jgi:hypothetical protein